jgi:hypothetical protein
VWKLNSFVIEIMQTKERRNQYGANPKGYLIITPERFMSIITGASHHKRTKIGSTASEPCTPLQARIGLRGIG